MRKLRILIAALVLGVAETSFASPIVQIDQQNLATPDGTNGGVRFGQSFTPTLSAIDAIEFLIGDNHAIVYVDLLDGVSGFDGLGGTVIATSLPTAVNLPSGHEMVHFDFPTRVTLVPGHTYVARLAASSGTIPPGLAGVSLSLNDLYPGGQFLEEGFPIDFAHQPRADMIFVEGLTAGAPAPAT